jgi:hypothetical protein
MDRGLKNVVLIISSISVVLGIVNTVRFNENLDTSDYIFVGICIFTLIVFAYLAYVINVKKKVLNRNYVCPNCGKRTISFWKKFWIYENKSNSKNNKG